jgi:EXLDI family protein
MQATDTGKVTVPVGRYDGDGVFLGEMLRFTGDEVGSYTDHRSRDDRGTTYTLYRTLDGRYRVHVHEWTRWQGEDADAWLWPEDGETADEGDARQQFPELFAALGMPDVYDLD